MSKLTIEAAPRTALGGKVKALRREGWVPVVVYGNVDAPVNLQVNHRALERMLHGGGSSQLVEVTVQGGGSHNVLIRDIQRHPVRRTVIHADFYAINLSEKQQVSIPVVAVNEPDALSAGLMMLQALDEIEIEALPPTFR
ncbi:MAG: 50S ribosomal protein L25 [Caldilineaceae bacterium]